ncbi:flagellar hook capping FlgD N-terminal domain-containing protein [Paenibacillus sp. LHD-38]|uniref:flagellar hook capping FlgD N-terminal domain-containing protein n=1 Tax=Paenibacillus sp. LHD-38 TaxID=3072143 RepID=UPI00280F2652|nr:flagellar hook capping FlgD N-terminal domain-containing protein [Paenibacillus sp. LHD-38]MDQ8733356.1 flagellar hook capping FlgD N-terminal domain-containing protein [Paenibacillus sp. LHD-38]
MADSVSTRVVWPNYSQANVQAAANKKSTDTLGKDQFLSILVTQLRNQDPMQPLQDKDFIAQMAQFTSVEQLMNMSTELTLMRQNIGSASSLIGKTIEWNEYDDAGEVTTVKGIVDSIISKEGILYARVGGAEVALDYVTSISETDSEIEEETEEDESSAEKDASTSASAGEGAES